MDHCCLPSNINEFLTFFVSGICLILDLCFGSGTFIKYFSVLLFQPSLNHVFTNAPCPYFWQKIRESYTLLVHWPEPSCLFSIVCTTLGNIIYSALFLHLIPARMCRTIYIVYSTKWRKVLYSYMKMTLLTLFIPDSKGRYLSSYVLKRMTLAMIRRLLRMVPESKRYYRVFSDYPLLCFAFWLSDIVCFRKFTVTYFGKQNF